MKLGLVGLPLSGKTTIFNAVSGAHGDTGAYHHAPGASRAALRVPDARLEQLARIVRPKKVTPAAIEYIDVPGVMADAGREEYLQNLAALREADALVHVVRYFDNPAAPHPRGSIAPARDAAELHDELIIADLDVVEHRIDRLKKSLKKGGQHSDAEVKELAILDKCAKALQEGKPLSPPQAVGLAEADLRLLRQFSFLTLKPILVVLNVGEEQLGSPGAQEAAAGLHSECLVMCGKLELEVAQLAPEERQEFLDGLAIGEAGSSRLVRASYRALGLRSFFTVVSDDLRAWTLSAGDSALTAAGKIHSDIARGFIRAEVVHFDDLVALGSFKAARDHGKLRLEGKEYEVHDGDVITFRFHV